MTTFNTFCGVVLLLLMLSMSAHGQDAYLTLTSSKDTRYVKGIIKGQKVKIKYRADKKRKVVKGNIDSIAQEMIFVEKRAIPISQITFIRNKSEYPSQRLLGFVALAAVPVTMALSVNYFVNIDDANLANTIALTPMAVGGVLLGTGLAGTGIILLATHKNGYRIPDDWTLQQVEPIM